MKVGSINGWVLLGAIFLSRSAFGQVQVDVSISGTVTSNFNGGPVFGAPPTPYSIDLVFSLPSTFGMFPSAADVTDVSGTLSINSNSYDISVGPAPGGTGAGSNQLYLEFGLPTQPAWDDNGIIVIFESTSASGTPYDASFFDAFVVDRLSLTGQNGSSSSYDNSNDAVVTVNSVTTAPVAPTIGEVTPVPTLPLWMLTLLGVSLPACAALYTWQRRANPN